MDINTIDKKLEDLALKYGLRLKTYINRDRDFYSGTFLNDSIHLASSHVLMISHVNNKDFLSIENSLRRLTDKTTDIMKLALDSVYGSGIDRNRTVWKLDSICAADELKNIIMKNGYGGDFDGDTVSKITITGGLTMYTNFGIKNVIFNDPATIVFWKDGTKTVVQAYNDEFDPEKGLAMAIAKKALGNKGNYYNTIKKWLPDEKAVNNADGEN